MTLEDAEKVVQEYGGVLAGNPHDGLAQHASRLPHSPERIVQAMELLLAYKIHRGSLTEEFKNEIGSAASILPLFILDEDARRFNDIRRDYPAKFSELLTQEPTDRAKQALSELRKSFHEAAEWSDRAAAAGYSLRIKLSHFIETVRQFDPTDPLFWQRVYTLAGLEYPAAKKRSFGDWFAGT